MKSGIDAQKLEELENNYQSFITDAEKEDRKSAHLLYKSFKRQVKQKKSKNEFPNSYGPENSLRSSGN